MDFEEFEKLTISDIEKWKYIDLSEDDIKRIKKNGTIVEQIFELKKKKLYLEYIRIKLQNKLSIVDPFINYNPIKEAENILNNL